MTSLIRILFPNFKSLVITKKHLYLQPWNYIFQISEDILAQGYDVEINPWPGTLDNEIVRFLREKGFRLGEGLPPRCIDGFLITPLAFGYFNKLVRKYVEDKRNCKIYGVLTTFLTNSFNLFKNLIKIKMTRTAIAASAVFSENIKARLMGKHVLTLIDHIITPSKDYLKYLPQKEATVYYPRINVFNLKINKDNMGQEVTTLLYFGPYTEERGVISLIKAYRKMKEEMKLPVRLHLLIRGKAPAQLKVNIKDLKLIERYLSKEHLIKEIIQSNIVVLPYRIIPSTIPLSYLEALMVMKPLVIAPGIPGFREHVSRYMPLLLEETYSWKKLAEYLKIIIESGWGRLFNKQKMYTIYLIEVVRKQKLKIY